MYPPVFSLSGRHLLTCDSYQTPPTLCCGRPCLSCVSNKELDGGGWTKGQVGPLDVTPRGEFPLLFFHKVIILPLTPTRFSVKEGRKCSCDPSALLLTGGGWKTEAASSCFLSPASHAVLGARPAVFRGMEQQQQQQQHGCVGGGTESPGQRDSVSPDVRGESPVSSGPPPCKSARLEVNGSPAAQRSRQNGTPQRPLGGGGRCSQTIT